MKEQGIHQLTDLPAVRGDEPAIRPRAGAPSPALQLGTRLQEWLSSYSPDDPETRRRFIRRIDTISEPEMLWVLLSWLDQGSGDTVKPDGRFAALSRLVDAECEYLRAAAYRWLADMHRLDLRYETRAKRLLKEGLGRESGLSRRRVRRLLRRA
jgi:hypothetical protein